MAQRKPVNQESLKVSFLELLVASGFDVVEFCGDKIRKNDKSTVA